MLLAEGRSVKDDITYDFNEHWIRLAEFDIDEKQLSACAVSSSVMLAFSFILLDSSKKDDKCAPSVSVFVQLKVRNICKTK